MIRALALFATLALLSACGADGEPERPEPRPQSGVSISGAVEFGIVGRS